MRGTEESAWTGRGKGREDAVVHMRGFERGHRRWHRGDWRWIRDKDYED